MRIVLALAACLAAAPALAACPDDAEIARLAGDIGAKRLAKGVAVDTLDDALCARRKLVAALEAAGGGKVVGYKAALTAKAVQERFKATEPVAGILLERMIVPDGARVPAAFGARPVFEADMLLVVKDAGIMDATTPEQALAHVSAMRPFIELPDLVLAPSETLEGVQLTAINGGARMGVAGAAVPLAADAATVSALADVKVVMKDGTGATLAEGLGSATLGNPLNALVWLAADLKKAGLAMKAGDLVSVGSFSPLTPPKPGQTVTVSYVGLPGTPTVSVTFE